MIAFVTTTWQGEPYNKEEYKHAMGNWFALEQLPKNLTPYAHEVISAYRQGVPYNQYGW